MIESSGQEITNRCSANLNVQFLLYLSLVLPRTYTLSSLRKQQRAVLLKA